MNPIDIAVAKARGIERSMEARRDGLVGVFQTLAKQHGELSSLFDRVRDDARKREALWPRIEGTLVAHERAEQTALFAMLDHYDELHAFTGQHAEEVEHIEAMVGRLDVMPIATDDWFHLFEALAEVVTAHFAEEERELFPFALGVIGPGRAKDLDDKLVRAFRDAKQMREH